MEWLWQYMLFGLAGAGAMHGRMTGDRSTARILEMSLVYVLAGYCGVLMFAVGLAAVIVPDWVATNMAGVPPGNAVMIWAGFFFLGTAAISMMTIWLRGPFLIGPVIVWSTYWAGATYAHLVANAQSGHPPTLNSIVGTFISHGLTALLLLGLAGALWRSAQRAPAGDAILAR